VTLEHEIKVPVASLAAVRARLEAAGAARRERETFEENWVLDDGAGSVRSSGCLLRVRRWGARAFLTFKGAATFAGGVKTREELETEIADPEAVLKLFAALGFTAVRRYQKHREAWELGGVAVALDRTPIGAFVELEGPPAAIAEAAATLAIDAAAAVPGSYLALWEAHRATHPGAPADMVFGPAG
jgi:adenylate cyclase class 2